MIAKIREFIVRRKILLFFLLIAATAGLFVYRQSPLANAKPTEKTYTVTKSDLSSTLTLTGTIEARESTAVRFASSGRLAWMGVKEGDRVQKYQALASLDQRDLKNRLQKYLNTFMKTRYDLDDSRDDYTKTSTAGLTREIRDEAKHILEKAQFDLNNAVLDVELQDLSIQYATVTAPIAGIITRIDKPYPGENITAATAEIAIVNPDTLYFSVTADQSEVIEITPGMTVQITLDPFSELPFTGTVNEIGFTPKAGETNTVYEVKVDLSETELKNKLRLGMTGDAVFQTGEKLGVLSVPLTYIKSEGDKKYVLVKNKGREEKKYVTVGEEFDNAYEIIAGVNEGDVLYD
jgi:RND family efflux transporter MFP subunit